MSKLVAALVIALALELSVALPAAADRGGPAALEPLGANWLAGTLGANW